MTTPDSYVAQTVTSDPGAFADLVAALPGDVPSLQAASTGLVFHYRGGGDWAEHGIAPERIGEVDLRYADALLGRLVELSDGPLSAPRDSAQKLVGCCRDYTLLLVSMARQHGIPARSRVGFAGYFFPGWWIDHVVAEIWDADQNRWKLVEAQLPAGFVDAGTGQPLEVLDVPRDRFRRSRRGSGRAPANRRRRSWCTRTARSLSARGRTCVTTRRRPAALGRRDMVY